MVPVIDMHCDTIERLMMLRDKGEPKALRENDLHIDLLRMKQAGYMCQCFAMFTPLGRFGVARDGQYHKPGASDQYASVTDFARALSDFWDQEIAANADIIRPAKSATDIEKNFADGFMSGLKTIEEGAVFADEVDIMKEFYERGVRMATLTWNFENELAFPNRMYRPDGTRTLEPETERGLKPAGRDVVKAMEEIGMIIDVSHLGDKGIWDILELVGPHTPVIASHSNARAVCGHPRNLTDEMLRTIADHGGVAGINYSADFLSDRGDNFTSIEDLITHMKYMKKVAGIDVIGMGTDFDGIGSKLEINGAGDMQKLADAMSVSGFTTEEIEKIFFKNVLRMMKTVIG